jgi:acyl-CoA dehydrogenase
MSVLNVPPPPAMADGEFTMFRRSVAHFLDENAGPSNLDRRRRDGVIEQPFWTEAADAGLLGLSTDSAYGGMGGDFRHEALFPYYRERR